MCQKTKFLRLYPVQRQDDSRCCKRKPTECYQLPGTLKGIITNPFMMIQLTDCPFTGDPKNTSHVHILYTILYSTHPHFSMYTYSELVSITHHHTTEDSSQQKEVRLWSHLKPFRGVMCSRSSCAKFEYTLYFSLLMKLRNLKKYCCYLELLRGISNSNPNVSILHFQNE